MDDSKYYTPILILCMMTLFSCSHRSNEEKANEWIARSKKPITVKQEVLNGWDYSRSYSLRDSNNDFYYTDFIHFSLPDTIK